MNNEIENKSNTDCNLGGAAILSCAKPEVIHKFQLAITDHQSLELPEGYRILDLQVQHCTPCLWVKYGSSPDLPRIKVDIYTYGTGHEITISGLKYIGTYQLQFGVLVFHMFQRITGVGG